MLSDNFHIAVARALRISDGVRLVRGWDNVVKLRKMTVLEKLSPGRKSEPLKVDGTNSASASSESIKFEADPVPLDQDREIRHLIFVIHGIGQKMNERVVSMDLAEEVDILRHTLIKSSDNFKTLVADETIDMPKGGGIQVAEHHSKSQKGTTYFLA